MSTEDVYYQFPIRALTMGKKINEVTVDEASTRWNAICDYCLVDYGTKNSIKAGCEHTNQVASDYLKNKGISCKSYRSTGEAALVFFAANRLGVVWPKGEVVDISFIFKNHRFIDKLSGGNMHVRLRKDLFWDLKNMGWREWSILCGVYGMLGNRLKVRLCYKQVNALALGFDSVTQIGSELKELTMTPRQTQITVDKLRGRNLFSKSSINFRHNWYSHKPQEELEDMLIDSEVHKQKKRLDTKASEATARGRAEVLRQLELHKRASAKAQLAEMKTNPQRLGKA